MKIIIDTEKARITKRENLLKKKIIPLYSQEGFELISKVWLKQEWNQQHWKSLTWLGLPIMQLPEDVLRLQEVVWQVQPDLIIETGVKLGGSSAFFASMCKMMGKGRVISVDISIPGQLRENIAKLPFADLITLIEGDSASPEVISQVESLVNDDDSVLVFLDSDHSKSHVMQELQAYSPLVKAGSYIIATDGVMQSLADTPNGHAEWRENNPAEAAREFVSTNPDFEIHCPPALCGDNLVVKSMTFWPDAWIRRKAD